MNTKNLNLVESHVAPIVQSLGLTYVDCDFKKIAGTDTLTIYIDKPNGVSLHDCETVSKAIDTLLDDINPTNGAPYNLNVSSPGLDRPLTKDVDYERNLNKEIEVKFYSSHSVYGKIVKGELISYDNTTFEIKNEKHDIIKINKKDAAKILPVVKF